MRRDTGIAISELLGVDVDPFHQAQSEIFGRAIELSTSGPPMPFRQFVEEGWHVIEPETPFLPGMHVDAICEHLEWVAAGEIQRLVINIGPGYAKSLIVSVLWPAWMWTHQAGWRSIFSSYDDTLSTRDTVRSRTVMQSNWYLETFTPRWRFSSDQNVKGYYRNTRMGERLATSVDGKSTGFRGHCTVVDDPISARDRRNIARHEAVADWWDKVMSSRLNDQRTGARVIVHQRLDTHDLTGHVLAKGGYVHLCLPTEFNPKRRSVTVTKTGKVWQDPRSAKGELLFPALFSAEAVTQIKEDLGTYDYSAQHGQEPLALSGGIFKRSDFKFYKKADLSPVFNEHLQSWDLTFKKREDLDFVVGEVWSRLGSSCYLRFERRGQMGFGESKQAVKDVSAAWPEASAKLVEEKANGAALIEELRNDIPGLIAINNDGVISEAWAVQPFVEAGNVFIPDPSEWPEVNDWLDEVCGFPKGIHDDRVAAFAQAVHRMMRNQRAQMPPSNDKPQRSEAATVAHQRF
jgi:predicted phage terminase large subunit-like protein